MSRVLDENEVLLYGTRYPVIGPVRGQLVNPLPGKITQGDYTRDDEQVLSSWVMTSFSGGLGVINGEFPKDQDRFNFATLETRYPRQLSLAPLVTQYSTLAIANLLFDYNDTFYAVVNTTVYSWDEDTTTFSSAHTLTANATDYCLFQGSLYIATSDLHDIEVYDGSSWSSITGVKAEHLVAWDDKLFAMDSDGDFSFSATPTTAASWESCGSLDLPTNDVVQLLVFFNAANSPVIHAVTKRGLYAYDFGGGRTWYPTPMMYPVHPNVGKAAVWRGELYIPAGSTIYKYNNSTIQVVGPDKDEGLPSDYRGAITYLVATHPFYFAIVNAANPSSSTTGLSLIYTGSHRGTTFFAPKTSRGLVLVSPGDAWHTAWQSPDVGYSMSVATVSNADGTYRLWFATAQGIYGIDLPTGLHNPLQNPTQEFQETGQLTTPWFDAGWAEIDKLALKVKVTAEKVTDDESYDISAQWDESMEWEPIGSATESGRRVFDINRQNGGRLFRRVRFRVALNRGSDATLTPVIRSIALSFTREPPPVWGYQFSIDFSRPEYKGKTIRQLRRKLKQDILDGLAGTLCFTDPLEGDVEVLVKFSRQADATITGVTESGTAVVSVIEIESINDVT